MDNSVVAQPVDEIDITTLMRLIPHRYPMLMIDKMIDVVPYERAIGVKNVTINEPFFPGHFPAKPVMPGVFLIEAMAQTSAALVVYSLGPSAEGKLVYFMTIDDARFRKPVEPGDQVRIHVMKERNRGAVWKFRGEAMVGDTLVAEATYSAMIKDV